jgi:hypothetical protein
MRTYSEKLEFHSEYALRVVMKMHPGVGCLFAIMLERFLEPLLHWTDLTLLFEWEDCFQSEVNA